MFEHEMGGTGMCNRKIYRKSKFNLGGTRGHDVFWGERARRIDAADYK